ncbi:hypothetical protein BHM03_00024635 [Ensete ventricosum]|nr:hypothetical protein BHM03_00024635 [Ensete ventricosum]
MAVRLLFTISFPSLNTTLRDLEVMKVGHDLDTAVTKGSLVSIREQYNIPIEYGLHIPQPGSAELLPTIKVGRLAIFLSVVRIGDSGLTGWRTRSEPTASIEELEMPIESAEEVVSPIFHHPRSMKDLCGTKVRKDDAWYYALYMSDLTHQDPDKEMEVRWEKLKNSTKIWNDPSVAEEFERGLLHPQLMRELYTLPSEVLLARATKEMVLVISRPSPSRGDLSEAQRQLKEAWVRARKMDDELLQSMKDLESTRAELPRRAVDNYKESASFKEGLKRMG